MGALVKLVTAQANCSASISIRKPLYFTLILDETHRGRTVVNYTYWGHTITIRVLSNSLHNHTFKSLGIPDCVQEFLKQHYVGITSGLKILAGPTYSGKNTTIISVLDELHRHNDVKIVSVENPMEILTEYIEQINAETPTEFQESVASTLRQNPDIVYIAEMTDQTATETMKIANTGKEVLSTIHVNSIAEVPFRIHELTGMGMGEIIAILDSVVYQNLLPRKCHYCNDDGCDNCYKAGVVPVFSYLHINRDLRRDLIGKSAEEIYCILETQTMKSVQAEELFRQGVISQKTYYMRKGDL